MCIDPSLPGLLVYPPIYYVPCTTDYPPMRFDILTIFPQFIEENPYFKYSIIGRAINKKFIKVKAHDIRKYSKDKHKKVDDIPYGGGAGMVMTCQPIFDAIKAIKKQNKGPVIFLTPHGEKLTHEKAQKLAKKKGVILLCGRYEGVDQRVRDKLIDEEISIGDYVLTGGELPAMIVVDTITRLLPGVLHDDNSALEDSFTEKLEGKKEYPHYTRPEVYKKMKAPKILLSGNHAEIEKWRKAHLKV
ncbi:MAG: tRNA (guanine-N(1)-)-methyltransferase [Candidatus Peregrinibacteria bacterium GW2011_GWA2_43_8]|nr:MAG: tRNA (guanine-N(1)-)-methyltransferase [Candidatus Peregrinibacteria bacterium GW2011_GWA2_43_8]